MRSYEKEFSMTRCFLLLCILAASASTQASAAIIGFEDLSSGFVPTSYQGFTWSGGSGGGSWVLGNESNNIFPGTEAHSGSKFAWSNGGTSLTLSDGLFSLDSFWARTGAATTFNYTVKGFLGATELYSQNITATQTYQQFVFNYTGIDKITISAGNNLLLDDITVNSAAAVPEPASVAIWGGLGIAYLFAARRWNKYAT
jgi:hypothetical protein